ncbi:MULTISPECIES: hypothetical protein [unclassified Streptomyces]|uniref:hypothetical protein n=1 Tax=unclassified Streptomyces TaxID=2593676 RepID=UPI00095977D3|nr:hypothetical protein [Streptomyces sp. TSRI0107]OKJ80447.1 hypothetical protein AMK31_25125 [Streptomyces sp. TSRI0107]
MSGNESVWEGGAAALRDALGTGDPDAWADLDLNVRGWAPYRALPTRAQAAGPLDAYGLALALCHRDGRVREVALGRLLPDHPELLPLAVVRAADWADPVRDRARDVLRTALDPVTAVALAPLILLVGRRERGAYAVGLLTEVLRRTPLDGLAPLLRHRRPAVRRFAHRLAVEEGLLSPAELAHTAARDTDVVVLDLCAQAALAAVREGRGTYDDVLPSLLGARHPSARSTGVTALRAAGRMEAAEAFLSDRSGLVRACARYVVRQGGGDPRTVYLGLCARPGDPALPPGAVLGLAECGERADAGLLVASLAHPSRRVRARAVAGLRLLDAADTERMRALLDDPAPGVVREAAAALLPSASGLPEEWLTERLAAGRPQAVRVAAFRLLIARGGVVRLRAAVGLLHDPDPKLRHWAAQTVQRWRGFEARGHPEVGELLDRSAHLFSSYVLKRRKWEAGLPA